MSIRKSELRAALEEVAEEALEEKTKKERAEVVEAFLDRIALDFDVVDDEDEEEEGSPAGFEEEPP